MKQQGKGGTIRYLLSLVKCLLKYKMTITSKSKLTANKSSTTNILSVSVGNCRFNGGGMMTMPKAVPNDGTFWTSLWSGKSPCFKFAANVKNLYDGTFINKIKEVRPSAARKPCGHIHPAHSA